GLRAVAIPTAVEFSSETGKGVGAQVEGHRVDLGSADLMKSRGIDLGFVGTRADAMRERGHTVLVVAVDGRVAGLIAVHDPIRPSTAEAVQRLKADGLHLIMVTGDHRPTAEAIALERGIDEVRVQSLA